MSLDLNKVRDSSNGSQPDIIAEEEKKAEDDGPEMELIKMTVKLSRELMHRIQGERAMRYRRQPETIMQVKDDVGSK